MPSFPIDDGQFKSFQIVFCFQIACLTCPFVCVCMVLTLYIIECRPKTRNSFRECKVRFTLLKRRSHSHIIIYTLDISHLFVCFKSIRVRSDASLYNFFSNSMPIIEWSILLLEALKHNIFVNICLYQFNKFEKNASQPSSCNK